MRTRDDEVIDENLDVSDCNFYSWRLGYCHPGIRLAGSHDGLSQLISSASPNGYILPDGDR